MKKRRSNFSLSYESFEALGKLAEKQSLSMSTVLQLLIMEAFAKMQKGEEKIK